MRNSGGRPPFGTRNGLSEGWRRVGGIHGWINNGWWFSGLVSSSPKVDTLKVFSLCLSVVRSSD